MLAARVVSLLALCALWAGLATAVLALRPAPSHGWEEHGRVVCPPAEPCYFEDWSYVVPEPELAPPSPYLAAARR